MSDEVFSDDPLLTRTEVGEDTVDLPTDIGLLSAGQVLGDRYEILEMLGRGGMGEVWRAFDLKLRVEVALKALRDDLFQSERRKETLRQEVRAAREVISPNVCRIFDLIEIDGRELVSMEYVDGATLLGVMQERGPLELKEAQDIASQFLSGLEAIHRAGLVHRDVKPENIMLTRAGRVVVMDFGLARGPEGGTGSVSGTPAYMAPEHAAGQDVDARADVYAAGVVLAEMVSPEGLNSHESRQSVWEGIRSEPAQIPDSPWASVIRRAVARDREHRPNSAHTLIRELEDVTLRVDGAEDLHPYPGLTSFTEEDAEYFFGREAEIEAVWRRLEGAHLLAIVGASGAGKSSFIEAGLRPNAPPGWRIARCTPGNAAISSLRRALVRELAGDTEALELLVESDSLDSLVEAAARWRRNHDETLLVIDQFEELVTQNPVDEQARFASLVGRLAIDADLRVLIAMRDDFLLHCNRHDGLRPVFATLTPLDPPTGAALRRAVIQPALQCGYRFEDNELVEEILAEVEGERGALPMLAFAASRLWEKRDREDGLLTRQAYHEIGGVGGALAKHAEAIVERIGVERIPVVRELFRNLVTADGTRAVREWDELLSVFEGEEVRRLESEKVRRSALPSVASQELRVKGQDSSLLTSERSERLDSSPDRGGEAAEVLAQLINARLLTSYEVREDEHDPVRQVEIIHESLLANWPRLVRWQTQDAEGAQFRDDLRQAARAWDERGRHDDRLWTGTAYREFELWRERYPGGLTEIEEAFAAAMSTFATRRRRRRRLAVSAVFLIMLAVLVVVGALWQRSVRETRRAEAAAERAEAQKLLALGELAIEEDPTEALAWARASLGVADTPEGRLFAVRALSKGPVARVIELGGELGMAHDAIFSPDGEWVALRGIERLNVYHRSGGGSAFTDLFPTAGAATIWPFFDPSSTALGAMKPGTDLRIYSTAGFAETARYELDPRSRFPYQTDRGVVIVSSTDEEGTVELWRPGSSPDVLATTPPLAIPVDGKTVVDSTGEWLAYVPRASNNRVYLRRLTSPEKAARLVHVHNEPISGILLGPDMNWVAVRGSDTPTIELWSTNPEETSPLRTLPGRGLPILSIEGSRIVEGGLLDGAPTAVLWDLNLPAGAEPMVLRWKRGSEVLNGIAIDPAGRWVVAGTLGRVPFWPLPSSPTMVFPGEGGVIYKLAFTPDGRFVAVPNSGGGGVLLQPITADDSSQRLMNQLAPTGVAVDPRGRFVIASRSPGGVTIGPIDGSPPSRLEGLNPGAITFPVAIHPERNLVAAGVLVGSTEYKVIGVWDLRDESVRVLGPADDAGEGFWGGYWTLTFLRDGSLLSQTREGVVRRWTMDDGSSEVVAEGRCAIFGVRPDGHTAVIACVYADGGGELLSIDFATGERRALPAFRPHDSEPSGVALSTSGDLFAVGYMDGTIQLGTTAGGEPWHLLGHTSAVFGLAFSPDDRLLATAGQDGSVRIWPVPDLSKPPIQALPYQELLAALDSFTNLRAVRDEGSSSGWRVQLGPFPGWETAPAW